MLIYEMKVLLVAVIIPPLHTSCEKIPSHSNFNVKSTVFVLCKGILMFSLN